MTVVTISNLFLSFYLVDLDIKGTLMSVLSKKKPDQSA